MSFVTIIYVDVAVLYQTVVYVKFESVQTWPYHLFFKFSFSVCSFNFLLSVYIFFIF